MFSTEQRVVSWDDWRSEMWEVERTEPLPPDPNVSRWQQPALVVDSKHLTREPEYYLGAQVWIEGSANMSGVKPRRERLKGFDAEKRAFVGQVTERPHCRYYLEDKPHYLDEPSEYYLAALDGGKHRLFVRLPEDRDPRGAHIEGSRLPVLVTIESGCSHLAVSGLSFTHTYWPLAAQSIRSIFAGGGPACIEMAGHGRDLAVTNCRFTYVAQAIKVRAEGADSRIEEVLFADNEVCHAILQGAVFANGATWGGANPETVGVLTKLQILRNRFFDVGGGVSQNHCLQVHHAEEVEVAGNFTDRTYGSGVHIWGTKSTRLDERHKPFARLLIHHNKCVDTLLNTCDFGGIETWQGGPTYVYNNISGNPGGYWHFELSHPDSGHWRSNPWISARMGPAYYLDGAFKQYYFNNIAWGKNNEIGNPLCNSMAFQEVLGTMNKFFNNTAYMFGAFSTHMGTPNQYATAYLANVLLDISHTGFHHRGVDEENARELAVGHNIQCPAPENVSSHHPEPGELNRFQQEHGSPLPTFGEIVEGPVVRDAAGHDFRPTRARRPSTPASGTSCPGLCTP
jgi:hypothetical protein